MISDKALKFLYLLQFCLALSSIAAKAQEIDSALQNQAVILQYHHISSSSPPSTSTSIEDFKRHMDYLADNNFTILPLPEILESLQKGINLPNFTAAITFDDGYLSVYTSAFPILKEKAWPFTVFVTTGLLQNNSSLYANWEQVREMAEHGATIANHTITHPYLLAREAAESENDWINRVSHEITGAEDEILKEIGQSHRLLAYPYGEYDPVIQKLTSDLGFIGIAQHSGPINAQSDFSALPRFPLSGIYTSMTTFPNKVRSLAFTLNTKTELDPITNDPSPSAVLDIENQDFILEQLSCYNNGESINISLLNETEAIFRIDSHIENFSRRFRYNCTAPGKQGRYFWYSIPWINPLVQE